jgi:hypothetical protein
MEALYTEALYTKALYIKALHDTLYNILYNVMALS